MTVANRFTFGGIAALLLWSTTFGLVRSLTKTVGVLPAAAGAQLLGALICRASISD